MTDLELLKALDKWIQTLSEDAKELRAAIDLPDTSREAKKLLVGGLSYLIMKIDLIPDYIGGVGVLDDASVLRVAAFEALKAGMPSASDRFKEIAGDLELVKLLLEDHYDKFSAYVVGLPDKRIRNRTADVILDEKGAMDQFDREIEDEVRGYKPKPLGENERTLREFRSFIKTKVL
ncbi:DUF1232 domain-containing protein [Myxococcota bacterium]|nr:DUF1232 domain-containing protein [Myxococcota bacterium]MBU1379350.1 DUF1232 domain-containing protein [Myxococcota bacterium]MBU1497046.1 DUF1232 domain-containing protein [Myxococcota bacterium]